jgi:hypothetical protein
VGELQEDPGREGVDGGGDLRESRDESVVVNGRLARPGFPLRPNIGMSGNDEADLAPRQAAIELDQPGGDRPILLGHELGRRGADEPVGNHQAADPDRREKGRCLNGLHRVLPMSGLRAVLLRTAPL